MMHSSVLRILLFVRLLESFLAITDYDGMFQTIDTLCFSYIDYAYALPTRSRAFSCIRRLQINVLSVCVCVLPLVYMARLEYTDHTGFLYAFTYSRETTLGYSK